MTETIVFNIASYAHKLGYFDSLLSEDELARRERFKFARDREQYVICRGMLRVVLADALGVLPAALSAMPQALRFGYNPHGKPYLAPQCNPRGLHFNMSHSGEWAVIVISHSGEIGVDIEQVRPLNYLELAQIVFSPHEQATLRATPVERQQAAFFNGWTRKEAFIKAKGAGLTHGLQDFDVSLDDDASSRLIATRPDPDEARHWVLQSWSPATHYVACVCWRLL
jgi:4'-phosphopantetheinyl transferase